MCITDILKSNSKIDFKKQDILFRVPATTYFVNQALNVLTILTQFL